MDSVYQYPCPRCAIGLCRPTTLTYVTTVEKLLLSVPDTLAYVCDVCNYREFDAEALDGVETLLEADPQSNRNPQNFLIERNPQRGKPA